MATIRFKENSYNGIDNESVLDILLRHQIAIPYGCRAGACQACTLQASPSQIPDDCQQGLGEGQIHQGYFLACQCRPMQSMDINTVNTSVQKTPATVVDKTPLDDHTLRLRLSCRLRWRAGQYITLWMKDVARCYSIVSAAHLEPYIELHIRVHPRGIMSQQLFANTKVGDVLELQGPLGNFVYEQEHASQPLLLIGSGTGIAPLIGIAREAIDYKHEANIHLIALDRTAKHYAMAQLETLKNSAPQCSFQTEQTENAESIISSQFPNLRGQRVYLCGGQDFVQRIRKKCFMLGASPRHIITEEFINFGPQNSN